MPSMTLAPRIEGRISIGSPAAPFLDAFRRRVAAGLLTGKPQPRSSYAISDSSGDRVRVHATDWWTAINVGLNDIELELSRSGAVEYRVQYWRWATYAIALSGLLGLVGLVLLLGFDARGYIASDPHAQIPGLTIDQNLLVAWAMVLFWGFLWPWLLIALHKRPLSKLVARIVAEVDAAAGAG